MAKQELSDTQLALLRKLWDEPRLGTGYWVSGAMGALAACRALERRGLAKATSLGGRFFLRTPTGRALVEAADKLLAEQDAAERDFAASITEHEQKTGTK